MKKQLEVISESLIFSKLSQGDFHLYSSLVMNGDVMKYITGKALSPEEAETRFQKALQLTEINPDCGFFIVRNKLKEQFIGVSKLVPIAGNQYEIGYMLLPGFWGKGLASEIVESLVNFARDHQIAAELIGIVDPDNPASIKVLTKVGFKLYETGEIDGLPAAYYKLALIHSRD